MFRKIDALTLTLIFTVILFFGTLFYLYETTKNEELAVNYYNKLDTLLALDKEFDIFISARLHYINYDAITKEEESFEAILQELQNLTATQNYSTEFTALVKEIHPAFDQEKDLLEYHKSINSITLNALHYLFDLRETINSSIQTSIEEKKDIDEMLFLLMQLFSGLETQVKTISNILTVQGIHKNKNINYFYEQSEMLLKNIHLLDSSKTEHRTIMLKEKINKATSFLLHIKEKQNTQSHSINQLFAFGLITLLLLLIYLHQRALAVKRELIAFKIAIEHSDNSIVMTDLDFNITYANESFEKNTGYSQEEILGRNPNILKSGLTDSSLYQEMHATLERGDSWNGEFINKRKDNSIFYERTFILPIKIKNKIDSYLAIKLDVTAYKEHAERMQLTATVFDSVEEGILVTNAKQEILSINKAFTEMFGYTVEECIGKTPKIFRSEEYSKEFYTQTWNEIDEKGIWKGKIHNRAKDGTIITLWMNISVVKDENGEVVNYISIHTNLADIIKSQEKIDFLAYHDSLTKLPNRIHFEETLAQALKTAKRKHTQLSILFIDLDRFKIINDTLGHHIGDELLKHVALAIRSVLRDVDMLARIGGDEFVVTLEDQQNTDNAATIANKILVTNHPIKF